MCTLNRFIGCTLLALAMAASPSVGAVPDLLAQAEKAPLSADDLAELTAALADAKQSAHWQGIAQVLMANWQRCRPGSAAEAFHRRWASDPQKLAAMEFPAFKAVFLAIKAFEHSGRADDAWKAWIGASDRWKKLSAADLRMLGRFQRDNMSPGVLDVMGELARHAWPTYLRDFPPPDNTRTWDCIYLACEVGPHLSGKDKKTFAAALVKLLRSDRRGLSELSSHRIDVAACALSMLGGSDSAVELLAGWMSVRKAWPQECNAFALRCFGYKFGSYRGASAQVALQKKILASHIWTSYLSDPRRYDEMTIEDLVKLAGHTRRLFSTSQQRTAGRNILAYMATSSRAHAVSLDDVRAARRALGSMTTSKERSRFYKAWMAGRAGGAEKLTELARMYQANPPHRIDWLVHLARLMREGGMLGRGKGHSEYAGALRATLKRGTDPDTAYRCWLLALPLGTEATRKSLAAELVDSEGIVRYNVARVLTWANHEYVSSDAFPRQVDRCLSDPSVTGDRRASWLLARAYGEAARSGEYSPLGGRKWMEQAIVACRTERMTLHCLDTLAMALGEALREDEAQAVLASAGKQLRGDSARTSLAEIGERVARRAASVRQQRDQEHARMRDEASQSHTAELTRRLATARARGDIARVRRLERMLASQK